MSYQQTTRAQLRQLVRNQLGNAANTFWRDDELNISVIQPSLRFFNLLTGYWKTRITIMTSSTTPWYALPSAITSNLRVSWQGYPLTPASIYDLDFGRPVWESETTATGGDVPSRPKVYGVAGLNLIAIWPGDAVGNSQLVVDGIVATPLLTTDASFVDIGQEELSGLLDMCQVLAAFKEGGKEFQDAQGEFKDFLKAAGERNTMLRASTAYRKYLGLDTGRHKLHYKDTSERLGAR